MKESMVSVVAITGNDENGRTLALVIDGEKKAASFSFTGAQMQYALSHCGYAPLHCLCNPIGLPCPDCGLVTADLICRAAVWRAIVETPEGYRITQVNEPHLEYASDPTKMVPLPPNAPPV